MLYFAYGSNMSVKRLNDRKIHAVKIGIGELKGYEIVCNKISDDKSLKFNIQPEIDKSVFGIVYNVSDDDLDRLDRCEGKYYIRETVEIVCNDEYKEVITYICTCKEKIDNSGKNKPYSWYVQHALTGAREAGIDPDYIKEYINIPTKENQR